MIFLALSALAGSLSFGSRSSQAIFCAVFSSSVCIGFHSAYLSVTVVGVVFCDVVEVGDCVVQVILGIFGGSHNETPTGLTCAE